MDTIWLDNGYNEFHNSLENVFDFLQNTENLDWFDNNRMIRIYNIMVILDILVFMVYKFFDDVQSTKKACKPIVHKLF